MLTGLFGSKLSKSTNVFPTAGRRTFGSCRGQTKDRGREADAGKRTEKERENDSKSNFGEI